MKRAAGKGCLRLFPTQHNASSGLGGKGGLPGGSYQRSRFQSCCRSHTGQRNCVALRYIDLQTALFILWFMDKTRGDKMRNAIRRLALLAAVGAIAAASGALLAHALS